METNSSMKVFINPNFNKNININNQILPNNTMHVNPKFSQYGANVQNHAKIFINPNFIKANPIVHEQLKLTIANHKLHYSNLNKDKISESSQAQPVSQTSMVSTGTSIIQSTDVKSRYCLVRHNVKKQEIKPTSNEIKTIVKINKYKSIKLNGNNTLKDYNLFRSLENAPITEVPKKIRQKYMRVNIIKKYIKANNIRKSIKHNRFKFVKQNDELRNSTLKSPKSTKLPMDLNKSLLKTNNRTKSKAVKGNLKINNIPCPLFRKYGKCLRMIRGKCEYLHDKKHVSICRNFLKGICHDKECLLSHELTLKKMPTCYFYLQGMCTKESCPYLHVKLNDKTKVCGDFLKGYCEKGDKCLNRHVNARSVVNKDSCLKKEIKINKLRKQNNYKYVNNRNKVSENPSHVPCTKNNEPATSISPEITEENTNVPDYRYYIKTNNDNNTEKNEIIKPSRCKLGTLPSFIKL